ncbi:hypothetical protein [Hydrogenovibrio sp. SC-1]|uniref:hypothetical protein n=1 Tax=Hydrogenovibrio sp. SC-1 TaxID=2065820 RepID=UPI001E64D852|nr:hypothetical protein [Hydrogenovibrio sp. SC-1]
MTVLLELLILFVFLALVWPVIKKENWKEKFIDNRHARSILIVFILILLFVMAISVFFDTFYPLERLK